MRNSTPWMILAVALSLVLADSAVAKPGDGQRGQRGPRERGGGGGLLEALDLDGDRSLSAAEIAQASSSLAKLDADGDGVVSMQEVAPNRGRGQAGQGRRGKRAGAEGRAGKGQGERGKGAGQRGGMNPQAMLERADADGDGVISKSEAPERMQQNWDRIDANGDGQIDSSEQAEMIERIKARMQEGGRRPRN